MHKPEASRSPASGRKASAMKKIVLLMLGLALATLALAQTGQTRSLSVGDKAPDFTLQGSDGKTHSLSDYRGKEAVVLAWFPKAQTAGCTQECKTLRDSAEALKKYQVQLFAASVDRPEDNKKFAENLSLPYPILSDPGKDTARAYGVLAVVPVAMRHTIYIGKDGKVLFVDKEIHTATAGEEMLARLEKLGVPRRGK